MTEDPWVRAIPEKYIPGHIIKGIVTKITNFGAFVELEKELEGLLHISELADHKVDKPQDVVKEGEEVEVKILKVDTEARKIGLSLRRAQWAAEEQGGETDQPQQQPQGPITIGALVADSKVAQATEEAEKSDEPEKTESDKPTDETVEVKTETAETAEKETSEESDEAPDVTVEANAETDETKTETVKSADEAEKTEEASANDSSDK